MRILILGGGGMLGHKMWQHLRNRYKDVYVTIRKKKSYYKKSGIFNSDRVIESLDLSDFKKTERILSKIKPSVVINCAGVTLRSNEAEDITANITINALLPHKLYEWTKINGARLIHFSTVCVFDGNLGNYTESSLSTANDIYGKTKFLGEVCGDKAITIRSSFIGRELEYKKELLEWFLSQSGRRIKGYGEAIFTGITTNMMADIVYELIKRFPDLSGVYHISSEVISKYELLKLMRDAFKIDIEIELDNNVKCRRNLKDEKFRKATGFKCPSWRKMMYDLALDRTSYVSWR